MLHIIRLKRRKDFVRTAQEGKKVVTSGLVLQTIPTSTKKVDVEVTEQPFIRVGFTATKKLGGAVVRNRIKRRLRALAQKICIHHAREGMDYVFIGRKAMLHRPFDKLEKDLKYALHQSQCYIRGE